MEPSYITVTVSLSAHSNIWISSGSVLIDLSSHYDYNFQLLCMTGNFLLDSRYCILPYQVLDIFVSPAIF